MIAVAPQAAEAVVKNIRMAGVYDASVIGRLSKNTEGTIVE